MKENLKLQKNAKNERYNFNSISCYDCTKLLVPRNGRKKLNIYN